jgi:hypothetical protein
MTLSNTDPQVVIADVTAVSLVIGTWANMLPNIAALLSIVWLLIRIWESETVRGWRGKKGQSDAIPGRSEKADRD